MTSPPERLSQIKERADKITSGEWDIMTSLESATLDITTYNAQLDEHLLICELDKNDKHNALFISHAQRDIPDLVAALEVAIEALDMIEVTHTRGEYPNYALEAVVVVAKDANDKIEKLMEGKE